MGNEHPQTAEHTGAARRIRNGLRHLRQYGPAYLWWKYRTKGLKTFSLWVRRTTFRTGAELRRQRRRVFDHPLLFSIVVPVYNTPKAFLKDMIRSVQAQTYGGWELCIADGSDGRRACTEQICRRAARRDPRIRYRKLDRNLGIAGNTNACLEMASGDFIALLDHDDILHRSALYEVMDLLGSRDADLVYTDEATFRSPSVRKITHVHFKPDFAPDNLRANNYICHFTAFRRSLLEKTGLFRSEYDGSQDHDMMLRIAQVTDRIAHIPKVLYFWRAYDQSSANSTQAKPYAYQAGSRAVTESLRAAGIDGRAEYSGFSGIYRVTCEINGEPLISIIIPNKDHVPELDRCLASIEEKSSWRRREIIIAENNSGDPGTFSYYQEAMRKWPDVRVVTCPGDGSFNYSAVNNYAVRTAARGDYILLLNNDTEVITENWLEEMLMHAQRKDVGAVGAMLYRRDETIQHAGVIVGMWGGVGHCFDRKPRGSIVYCARTCYTQDLSAVTGACMMIRREVWEQVGGLNEAFPLSYNDIDFCLSVRKAGYLVVWTPYAELYHDESVSRGRMVTPEKKALLQEETRHLRSCWRELFESGDPYFNPNLSLWRSDCLPAWKYYEPGTRRKKGHRL